ncbi:Pre-SET CXC domain [Dillenia turbinata]|uniref:Pre-SET CXC domain n=1 Tax=Dillenia turbinata TaxID=194707 RepID=A0AAN8UW98_9MAGN
MDSSVTRPHEKISCSKDILSAIDSLKGKVVIERTAFIQRRLEENRKKLSSISNYLYKLSKERRIIEYKEAGKSVNLLIKRQKDAVDTHNGVDVGGGDKDSSNSQEDGHTPPAVLLGSSIAVKHAVRPIKLTEVKKLPPYTTWIFLDRNQRMTEDQSVVGRKRIYYDQNGGEALICSDSEEEVIADEEDKKVFVESEDYILRMAIQEFGLSDSVLDSLSQCLSRKACEIKARYEILSKEDKAVGNSRSEVENALRVASFALDKDLDAALDSFDNLFCRRCLVFDCRLHGCSQDLVFPSEKQLPWNHWEEENVPCGPHCSRLALKSENVATTNSPVHVNSEEKLALSSDAGGAQISSTKKSVGPAVGRRTKCCLSESRSSNARNTSESSDSETRPGQDHSSAPSSSSPPKCKIAGKCGSRKRNSKRVAGHALVSTRKRQRRTGVSDLDSNVSGGSSSKDLKLRSNPRKESEDAISSQKKVKSPIALRSRRRDSLIKDAQNVVELEVLDGPANETFNGTPVTSGDDSLKKEEFVGENTCKQEHDRDHSWKAIEKGLFEKGLEIFGRSSCLIARNLLNGLKTCSEVFQYMNFSENKLSTGDGVNSLKGYSKGDSREIMGNEVRRRSRFLRRKGRVRRLKYTWKSAGHHSIRKWISERKDQPCRQYNPCGCKSACGKQCACLLNGTCCEKYCGCPKSCKNRFRGCHCAKSQCRSRQCPCYAADRECDPDVCRNCWVSCGDGTLGVPNQRGDNYECRNLKLLLRQQQRVLLGRSDVSGWGAFIKNNVGKHEYLGEYTGELISHREADKRGKIYDRENSSFLFNLNDQFVLDAYRKGDKLKFANHSPNPNCYAKVIMVAGDHRVGIFAKERICAGEELFYDYRYEPDRAPAWARKPEASGSNKEDTAPSSGRAKKLA